MLTTINEDSTFLITDEDGDAKPGADMGLYYQDTRFLSRYEFRLAGRAPVPLSSRNLEYFRAIHILTNPAYERFVEGSFTITRNQTVGDGLHEDIDITSYADTPVKLPLEIFFEADYADILEVRGQIVSGEELKRRRRGRYWASVAKDGLSLSLHYAEDNFTPTTAVRFSRPLQIGPTGDRAFIEASIPARGTWHL